MSRVFFAAELDTAASWWRIYRTDGVALAFSTHDRDLWFDGILHRAAPGLLPSAIRRTSDLTDDEAEVRGALSHDTITEGDIRSGRFDNARIQMGIVDWETLERHLLYTGTIAALSQDGGGFSAHLRSAKADLDVDTVPRTSPACRARFCGPGCTLSSSRYTRRFEISGADQENGTVTVSIGSVDLYLNGELRWIDGPHAGQTMHILNIHGGRLVLDRTLVPGVRSGMRILLREGCDKTIETCASRFANAANFQGEPHLPGNDLLAQYPQPR